MAYLTVENFSAGMDRRRERVAGPAGTLWLAKNVHITRGGDIEGRKKFVPEYSVANTFGAASVRGQLYVFGSADLASAMPIGVLYQRLIPAFASPMSKILDVKTFGGKLYVIAEYENGHVFHFYDGARVTQWDTIAETGASFEALASLMALKISANGAVKATSFGSTITIEALEAGTAFTITRTAVDGGGTNDQNVTLTAAQANVVAVAEVRAGADFVVLGGTHDSGNNTVSSIEINGVELLSAALDWETSNATTALRLAAAITNGYTTHGYTANASGTTVTVEAAPATGATPNGYLIDVVTTGDFVLSADATLAGGVTAVTAVAQIHTALFVGTLETGDTFTITVNGTAYVATLRASGTGRTAFVSKNRVFSPVQSLWRYSMLNRADIWDPADPTADNDAGFINIASESDGNSNIVVAARYQDLAAIFSGNEVSLFQLDQDPDNFAFQSVLENTSTRAAGAVVRYGNNDVFYLDFTGIRSLRARDASNAAFVSDVGNAIDPFVQEYLDGLTFDQVSGALAAIEPRDGRLWLVVGGRIFVLSYFPGAKISAWSYYETDEYDDPVQAIVKVRDQVFVRAGAYIYAYGGLDGETYPDDDESVAEIQTPFLSGGTPATIKNLNGFDIAGTNTWECEVAFDADDPTKTHNCGNFAKITYTDANKSMARIPGRTSMVSLVLTCRTAGRRTLSMASVHYEGDEAG